MTERDLLGPNERDEDEGEASDLALDDAVALPELDGEAGADDAPGEELAAVEDETVGLDDATAEEAAEAVIDLIADVEAESWETGEDDALDEDDELADGESESWREGSEDDTSTPLEIDEPAGEEGLGDAGDEGLEGDDVGELELPPRPAEADESYPDDL